MERLPIDGKKKTCHNILNQKVNLKGDALVEITYTNNKVKKYFEDHYRNLLGGLYRENPVKSRNYEAVKSSKKWENVGNSYIIPALLLYRYSYI